MVVIKIHRHHDYNCDVNESYCLKTWWIGVQEKQEAEKVSKGRGKDKVNLDGLKKQ